MAGVEAAASLFGSEDSGSDLFATLGADESTPPPAQPSLPEADLFYNTASSTSEAGVFDDIYGEQYLHNDSAFLGASEIGVSNGQAANGQASTEWRGSEVPQAYPQIPPTQPIGVSVEQIPHLTPSTYDAYGYNGYNEQHHQPTSQSNGYSNYGNAAPTWSHSSYSAYDPPASKALPTRSAYDTYSSPAAQPNYQTYEPLKTHVSNATNYGTYGPSAPSTNIYNPPVPAQTTSQPVGQYHDGQHVGESYNQSTSHASPDYSTGIYAPSKHIAQYAPEEQPGTYVNSVYSPPVAFSHGTIPPQNVFTSPPPLPVKMNVTRPKVSNAYDPPFLPSTNSRRTTRPGASQFQAQYQAPPPDVYSKPPMAATPPDVYSKPPMAATPPDVYSKPPMAATPPDVYSKPPMAATPPDMYSKPPMAAPPSDMYSKPPMAAPPPRFTTPSYNQYAQESEPSFNNSVDRVSSPDDAIAKGLRVMSENDMELNSGEDATPATNYLPDDLAFEPATVEHNQELDGYDPEASVTMQTQSRPPSTKPMPAHHRVLSPASIPLPMSPSPDYIPHNVLHKSSSPPPKSLITSEYDLKKSIPPRDVKYDPYAPKTNHNAPSSYIPRTSSPLSLPNGYQPDAHKVTAPTRSNLSNSALGPIPKPLNPASFHNYSNYAMETDNVRQTELKLGASDTPGKHLGAQYAPSPSLIGANDPLSRTSARAPVITFGFGGKLVTCFHGMPGLNAGFDVAFSSRTSSELKIRSLAKLVPESSPNASYPGPLLSDPGTSSLSLVRNNAQTLAKTKKASVLSYLSDRITELVQGVGYLGSAEKQTAENKIVLIKLLKVMIENEGRLLATPQAETAVRSALVPRLDGSSILQDAVSIQATFKTSVSDDVPITITTLRPSALDKIEELLLQGDRRQAYQFAMTEKLWAHAMIIASSIDKDAWREVAHDFLRTELGTRDEGLSGVSKGSPSTTQSPQYESLRVAYSLFAGAGPAAIQELVSQSLLQRSLGRLPPISMPATTPRTPSFVPMPPNNMHPSVPAESLIKWAETAAMIISSPLSPESAGALTALGDQLLANNMVEAAHSCYLLSPQTSLVGGLGSPSSRITLVGSKNPAKAAKDSDAIIFSEIYEFALSLVPVAKGQEPFHGVTSLQIYRFVKALEIAEFGDLQLANRYCDAITTCLGHTPTYGNLVLLEQLQGLQQRVSGVFHGDKSNSWIGGKLSKPSLDTIGGWLEGRFTKLVTGDTEDDGAIKDTSKTSDQPFAGPFAHYSTISSTTPSARSSPQPQTTGLTNPPPQRTSSAMSTATPFMQQYQVERSSSAMGYGLQRPPVHVPVNGSHASSLASSQSSPVGFGGSNQYNPPPQRSNTGDELDTPIQGGSSWWQESDTSNATPTNATFMKVDGGSINQSDDGFISLMDTSSYSVGPSTPLSISSRYNTVDEDDDDLGLGNSKAKAPKPETNGAESKDAHQEPAKTEISSSEKPAAAAAPAASGWLGRWFKKSDSAAPAPIKASLGEESAFYYDKEQKRWVNKKAGSEPPKPAAPPPPPSRTQSASPGMGGPKPPSLSGPPSGPPPNMRSVSAADLGEPPRAPMRIRSNLAPPTESAPSTPTGTRLNPGAPPPPRPKSQATKRNIRSRYVDILQQEGPPA